jgi:SsrA-binding protein
MAKEKKGAGEAGPPLFRRENRKARFKYELMDRFEAGLELKGTEVKSIRAGMVSIDEAYCRVKNGEAFVINLDISPYSHGAALNHEPKRPRKLLLHRREISRLDTGVRQRGFTIVPTRLYLTPKGLFKIEVALARGKATHDKRESIKEREVERKLRRYKR